MRKFLFLSSAQRFGDFALLLLRVFIGLFLVWNVWGCVTSTERMYEYREFLGEHGFVAPALLAPLSVYAQLLAGVGLVIGLLSRWAGILCAFNFGVAIVMIDHHSGIRGMFPSACLVLVGLYLATHGAGRFSIDAAMRANELPRANGSVRLKK